jgi:hypothetical protein
MDSRGYRVGTTVVAGGEKSRVRADQHLVVAPRVVDRELSREIGVYLHAVTAEDGRTVRPWPIGYRAEGPATSRALIRQ